jgi:hypothetical protein
MGPDVDDGLDFFCGSTFTLRSHIERSKKVRLSGGAYGYDQGWPCFGF